MTDSEFVPSLSESTKIDSVGELTSPDPDQSGQFIARFWGVRGSVPAPGACTVRYGGNTACVEVLVGGEQLIFDAGTGLRVLGKYLHDRQHRVQARLFFTHTHWDRIQGFPFFLPAFEARNRLDIYGAPAQNGASIKQRLTGQMLRPNFMVPMQAMQATMEFHNISAGSVLEFNDIVIETVSLNRHTSSLGYRISWGNRSLVYATDTDSNQTDIDPNLVYLAANADVLIFDGSYADMAHGKAPQSSFIPWEMGVKVAQASQSKQLVMFHHDPYHDDNQLDQLEVKIQGYFPRTMLAKEGMVLQLGH